MSAPTLSTLAKEATKLTSMPTELFEAIADDLAPADLVSLRQVNKYCQKNSRRLFKQNCFTTRKVRLSSEESLKRGLSFLKLDEFAPQLHHVVVSIVEYKHGAKREAAFNAARNGVNLQLLSQFFTKLKKIGINPRVTVNSYATKCNKRLQSPDVNDAESLILVLNAMRLATYRPPAFSINTGRATEKWYLPIHRLEPNGSLFLLQNVLSSVKSLTLDVWVEENYDLSGADNFMQCIAPLRDLESLTIYGRDDKSPPLVELVDQACGFSIQNAILDQTFPQLKILRVCGMEMWMTKIMEFLQRHRGLYKMEEFCMENITIDFIGFNDVFDVITPGVMEEKLEELTGVKISGSWRCM